MGVALDHQSVDLTYPIKLEPLFDPYRYKVAHGGRGGGKSISFAKILLAMGMERCLRILCTRELQNSITESVHLVLKDEIEGMGLGWFYSVTRDSIKGLNGTRFLFMGVKNNVTKIKSTANIDICWVEEAEKVSEESWDVLIPTIRKDDSEIWVSFNPSEDDDPTYQRFVIDPPHESVVIEINYYDNPWFPDVLRKEMEVCRERQPEKYDHIWLGRTKARSDAQIFGGTYSIKWFKPEAHWDGPYYGLDFGFATDPTVLVKCWIGDEMLWIEQEAWAMGCEIDDLPELFDTIQGSRRYPIFADNARPETISYMQRHGFPLMESCEKWPGSVEDGIDFIKGFAETIIHPECVHTIDDWKFYSLKVDRLTKKVTRDIVDADNHSPDAVRYAIGPMIKYEKPVVSGSHTVRGMI